MPDLQGLCLFVFLVRDIEGECRRCLTADYGRRFVNKLFIYQRLHHEKGKIYSACQVAFQNWIADVSAPYWKPLACTFLKIASAYNGPSLVATKDAAACLHLIVDIDEAEKFGHPARDGEKDGKGFGVSVLAIHCDVPTTGKNESRTGLGVIEDSLRRSGSITADSPWNEDGQHAVTTFDRSFNDLPVIRGARNDGNLVFESVELFHASFPADADDIITPIERMLNHVLAEFSGCSDNADFVDSHKLA